MPSSEEYQLERDFLKFAQEMAAGEEATGGDVTPDTEAGAIEGEGNPLDEKLDPSLPDSEEDALPEMDTDMAEKQAVKDLIPWDSFVILFDPHYAKTLQDSLQLPEPKAKSKSFYLYYAPENKRIEGIINKRYVGGYGQKETLGDDFEFLKKLSPEGFPSEWKEKAMSDIDELPAIENSRVKEELRKQNDEPEEEQEQAEDAEVEQEDKEEGKPKKDNTVPFPKAKTQEQAKPKPAGAKVDTTALPKAASLNELRLKRYARLQKLNKIKG